MNNMLSEDEKRSRQREASRKWKHNNKDRLKEYEKNRRSENPEIYRNQVKKWRLENPEKDSERHKQYYQKNKDKYKETAKRWRESNREKWRLIIKKSVYKRRRELGFISLNSRFDGAEAHHVNKECVIYIPEGIHKIYPHDHNNPGTMQEINKFAFYYLFGITKKGV